MQFLLIICHDDTFQPTPDLVQAIQAWDREMEGQGIRIGGAPLRPAVEAVTLRVREGQRQVEDGPFSDQPIQFAAYELIDVPDRQAALDAAASHPMAGAALIEIRPVWQELAG
jgi:hypothetical protein